MVAARVPVRCFCAMLVDTMQRLGVGFVHVRRRAAQLATEPHRLAAPVAVVRRAIAGEVAAVLRVRVRLQSIPRRTIESVAHPNETATVLSCSLVAKNIRT